MGRVRLTPAVAIAALLAVPAAACAQEEGEGRMTTDPAVRGANSITDVAGIEVGHHTLTERPTGCTVILARGGAVGGVDVRGTAPGTREVALLDPVNSVEVVHAVVLSGGSAFGLDAASGAVRWLEERNIGFDTGVARVPIVPAAILFDLRTGDAPGVRPGPECGYSAAAAAASGKPLAEGSVGAGAGAIVGKLYGGSRAMRGGIGTAAVRLPGDVVVGAVVAVSAIGSVVDPSTGEIIAGVRTEDGTTLADVRSLLRSETPIREGVGTNTTIGVVATNASLTKAQATKLARMAQDGVARAVYPSHLPWDGDTMFALATGEREGEPNLTVLGAIAADVVAEAILRAVRSATGLEGIPSVSDLAGPR